MKNMQVIESIVMNSLFFVILIVATVSNCLLLLVFRRRPGLRTISNRFVINLLITNVATCWLLIPLLLLDNMWLETRRGRLEMTGMILKHESICPIREGLSVGLCTANVLSVLLIGADQYFAVLDPLRYHASINAATSAVMIAVSWLFALAFAVAGGLTVSSNVTSWYVCDGAKPFAVLSSPYQIGFPILFTVLVFSVPFTSVCWIYFSIYSAAHRNSQRARRNGSIAGFNDVISPSPHDYVVVCSSVVDNNNSSSHHKSTLHHSSTKSSLKSTSSSIVNSLKRRISNSSLFRYREETRAARISALVIVMALVCWFPFTLLLVLRSPIFDTRLSYYVKQLGVLALTCSAVASPLIFAHRNRRIHKELCRLFRPSKRRYSFYDRYPPKKQRLLPSKQNDVKHKAATFDVLLTLSDSETVRASSVQHQKTRPISSTILSCLSKKNGSGGQNKKKKNKTVSILSKVWIIDRYQQRHNDDDDDDDYKVNRLVVDLPEVALEVDTSRSSFSSNSSATSTSTTESSQSSSSSYSSDIITPATTVDVISEKIKPAVES